MGIISAICRFVIVILNLDAAADLCCETHFVLVD
jgi:hypothetical protein